MVSYVSAINDFREARRQAALEQIMARLTGKSADLLSFDQVREMLKARTHRQVGLRDIPLDAIVGSVGRYTDFTRSFLPKKDSFGERWARVQMAVTNLEGVPPIEVYQIGEVYFVRDGNHRVSVARQLGAPTIQAYVTEIATKVPLSPDVQPDELILKAEYADFLENTRLDALRPSADLSITAPGRYKTLEEHIAVHRYFMGQEQEREIPYAEAVAHWYDEVYLPVVHAIRERGVLRDFPGRTETDLYLWLAEHRAELEEASGWEVAAEDALDDLAARFSARPQHRVARLGERVLDAVTPDGLESGPAPGTWRERRAARREDRLFTNVLVPVSGAEVSWAALEQALEVVQREEGVVRGLYVVPPQQELDSEKTRAVHAGFDRRCAAAGIAGSLAVEVGKISRRICERARWADLVILKLAHPPGPQPVARLASGFRTVILRCPSPVLAVPVAPSPLSRALLAYDGSPKAQEALYVAAYLTGRWATSLMVVSVPENGLVPAEMLARAQTYLESRQVQAAFVEEEGAAGEAILKTADQHGCDLILMGGYGRSPVVEVVLGSALDQVLRESRWPVLICR